MSGGSVAGIVIGVIGGVALLAYGYNHFKNQTPEQSALLSEEPMSDEDMEDDYEDEDDEDL